MSDHATKTDSPYFEVGAAARITGLSPNTLRTWERRNVIRSESRSPSGRRRYSQAQVEQLSLLKKLTDAGDAISALVGLDVPVLRKRLLEYQSGDTTANSDPSRIFTILVQGNKARDWLSSQSARFRLSAKESDKCDLIVADLDGSPQECRRRIASLKHSHPGTPIAIIYDFAPSDLIKQFAEASHFIIRYPCPKEVLEHYLVAAISRATSQTAPIDNVALPLPPHAPERVFTDRQLALIASSNPNIKCECPHHISALVASLASFENYCRRCEIESPKDADVHARLGKEIGQARSIVESALLYLCEKDNLVVPATE